MFYFTSSIGPAKFANPASHNCLSAARPAELPLFGHSFKTKELFPTPYHPHLDLCRESCQSLTHPLLLVP